MNRTEVIDLLSYAAACDQRTVGDTDVLVWFDQLAPLRFEDALTAMRNHYRRNPDVRLKPGHLWQMCRTMTDAEAAERDLRTACDHGTLCPTCSAVHQPDETCDVLKPRRFAQIPAGLSSLTEAAATMTRETT